MAAVIKKKYKEQYQRKKVEWVKYGFEHLPLDKHAKWLEYVDEMCKASPHYKFGNPITDGIKVIEAINATNDRKLLTEIVKGITGSNMILFKAAVTFSNKGELIQQINEELKTPPSWPKF